MEILFVKTSAAGVRLLPCIRVLVQEGWTLILYAYVDKDKFCPHVQYHNTRRVSDT
jgi:hypothetical protein